MDGSGTSEPAHERHARRGRRAALGLALAGPLAIGVAALVGPSRVIDRAAAAYTALLGPAGRSDPPGAAWRAGFCGDADADGHADVAVLTGARSVGLGEDPGTALAVFSGATGERLFRRPLRQRSYVHVSCPGDLDGDGRADLLLADPSFGVRAHRLGELVAISGDGGRELWRRTGEEARAHSSFALRAALEDAADVDADGRPDRLLVHNGLEPELHAWGDRDTWRLGRVTVRSGADDRVLLEIGAADLEP